MSFQNWIEPERIEFDQDKSNTVFKRDHSIFCEVLFPIVDCKDNAQTRKMHIVYLQVLEKPAFLPFL